MPVPTLITDLSTVVASNSPAGSESPATADDYFRAHAAFIAQMRAVIGGTVDANIPSAYATAALVNDYVTNQSQNSGTTGGTLTAYTLTPATALTSYSAGKTFWVTFHVASGAAPTLTISGVATPPNLVKRQSDGTLANIAAGELPINHRSRVTLISASQALVEDMPPSLGSLDTLRIDVASATTVNLTSSAPNTRHINITGTTTITGFTVAAGLTYFVRFNAALTLTNNANIVTQSGANITTAAGDTCVLRSTAANVVEVLSYKSWATQKNECTAWVNFNGTGTVAIRDSFNVSSITDNGTGDYTINFAVAMTNANYSVCDGVGPNNGSSPEGVVIGAGPSSATDVPPTTAGFRVMNLVSGATAFDITRLMFQVFGGK